MGPGGTRAGNFRFRPISGWVFLPPYAPELNPVEHLWDELREKSFHNRVFDSLDALEDHLEQALRDLENDPARVSSITAWSSIVNAL